MWDFLELVAPRVGLPLTNQFSGVDNSRGRIAVTQSRASPAQLSSVSGMTLSHIPYRMGGVVSASRGALAPVRRPRG